MTRVDDYTLTELRALLTSESIHRGTYTYFQDPLGPRYVRVGPQPGILNAKPLEILQLTCCARDEDGRLTALLLTNGPAIISELVARRAVERTAQALQRAAEAEARLKQMGDSGVC